MEFVWVFNGPKGRFPSGVFSSREAAEEQIRLHALTGTLTKYKFDKLAYQWAVEEGHFKPKRQDQTTSTFISNFADGSEHYHYEEGK